MESITLGELQLFHAIDRKIFARLVLSLRRQASQSLLIMALWLWLEESNSCVIMKKLTMFSDNLLDAMAGEALSCINILRTKTPTLQGGNLYLLTRVTGKKITLRTILQSKYTMISGVKAVLSHVCARIFTDILMQVLPTPSRFNRNLPLAIPGFPSKIFGALEIYHLPSDVTIPVEGLWGWKFNFEAPVDDRTLFLTFSKGFPVSEDEAKQFFIQMCGECIESFEIEVVNEPNKQALFATMTLRSVSFMGQIMNGEHMAKFRKNGKHIWARKFERRDCHKQSN